MATLPTRNRRLCLYLLLTWCGFEAFAGVALAQDTGQAQHAAQAQDAGQAETPEPPPDKKSKTDRARPSSPPSATRAQDAEQRDLARRTRLMEGWLVALEDKTRSTAMSSGVLVTAAGAIEVGLGSYLVLSQDDSGRSSSRAAWGTLFLTVGALGLATGIYSIAIVPRAATRLSRWAERRAAGPMDELTLARFEGELAAEARFACQQRVANGVGGIGIATGGAALAAFTAVSGVEDGARNFGYVMGGVFAAAGTAMALATLLSESAAERAWRLYRAGIADYEEEPDDLAWAPLLGPDLAGLALAARFP